MFSSSLGFLWLLGIFESQFFMRQGDSLDLLLIPGVATTFNSWLGLLPFISFSVLYYCIARYYDFMLRLLWLILTLLILDEP